MNLYRLLFVPIARGLGEAMEHFRPQHRILHKIRPWGQAPRSRILKPRQDMSFLFNNSLFINWLIGLRDNKGP